MRGTVMALSVVDSRDRVGHLVGVQAAALHRRSGRYPAMCGAEVLSASMLTEPGGNCRDCQRRAQAETGVARRRDYAGSRRSGRWWSRRAGSGMWPGRRRPGQPWRGPGK